jgi:hypothetical protein
MDIQIQTYLICDALRSPMYTKPPEQCRHHKKSIATIS